MVSLVPVRKRRRLGDSSSVRLGEGTYGNASLWENLWRACGCSTNNDPDEKKCEDCRGVYQWLCRFVSREALRISHNNILEIRGENTSRLVYINDERVLLKRGVDLSSPAANRTNTNNEWMGSIQLKVGNKLSLKVVCDLDNPMDFEVIDDPQPLSEKKPNDSQSKTGSSDEQENPPKETQILAQDKGERIQERGDWIDNSKLHMDLDFIDDPNSCEKRLDDSESIINHTGEEQDNLPKKAQLLAEENGERIQEGADSSKQSKENTAEKGKRSRGEEESEENDSLQAELNIDGPNNNTCMSAGEEHAEELSIGTTSRPASQEQAIASNEITEHTIICVSRIIEERATVDALDHRVVLKTTVPEESVQEIKSTPEKLLPVSSISSSSNTHELETLYLGRLEQRIETAARQEQEMSIEGEASINKTHSSNVARVLQESVISVNSNAHHGSNSTLLASNRTPSVQPEVLDLTRDSPSPSNNKRTAAKNERPPSIMFVRLGRELTNGRIRTLTNVAKRKGATVVTKLESNPTYLVIDAHVNVETLCSNLGFEKKMAALKQTISKRGITPVKPTWITNTKGKTFKAPKLFELYNGLIETRSPKKRPAPIAGRPKVAQSDDEGGGLVTEVPANGGPVIRNVEMSELLEKLGRLYNSSPIYPIDEMRAYTFNLVAGRLRCLNFDIKTHPSALVELRNTRGIGDSCVDVIKEWLKTGKVERIHSLETDEARVAFRNLNNIWGVGPMTAHRLFRNDFRTIAQVRAALRAKTLTLNDNQLVGVECYEDFRQKMSRREVEQIRDIVKKELLDLFPNAHIELMGSYRRGKTECGDGDLFVTDPGYVSCTPRLALGTLVRKLQEKGHIAYNLTQIAGLEQEEAPSGRDSQSSGPKQLNTYAPYFHSQSYMGVFNSPLMPGKRRRVDIKFYPFRERAFASVYFTGCGWFNRSMRLWATRKKNLQLNDHGVFPLDTRMHHVPGPKEKLLLEATSEVEIFDYLGLVYKRPHERNCFDDVVSTDGITVASLNVDAQKAFREEQRQGHKFRDEDDD